MHIFHSSESTLKYQLRPLGQKVNPSLFGSTCMSQGHRGFCFVLFLIELSLCSYLSWSVAIWVLFSLPQMYFHLLPFFNQFPDVIAYSFYFQHILSFHELLHNSLPWHLPALPPLHSDEFQKPAAITPNLVGFFMPQPSVPQLWKWKEWLICRRNSLEWAPSW